MGRWPVGSKLPPTRPYAAGRRSGAAQSVALAAASADLWSSYLSLLETAPLPTKAITAGVIIGAGDAAAQLLERAKTQVDFEAARTLRWAVFGLTLQGPWNHFFYQLLDGALPPTADPFTPTTIAKVAIDQFVQAPIFTVIILYYFAIVEGRGLEYAKQQVQNEIGPILLKNWGVFLPATAVNLAYCPPQLRVLFLNSVFFGWVCYLSLFLNGDGADDPPNATKARLLRAGARLAPEKLSAPAVRAWMREAMADPAFREHAREVSGQMEARRNTEEGSSGAHAGGARCAAQLRDAMSSPSSMPAVRRQLHDTRSLDWAMARLKQARSQEDSAEGPAESALEEVRQARAMVASANSVAQGVPVRQP